MSNDGREVSQPDAREEPAIESGLADRKRRKFATAGLAGAGVLMTLPGRSALGAGLGQCGSETASAALSRHGEPAMCGCSPGFWWRSPHGLKKWEEYIAQYHPSYTFNDVFGVDFFVAGKDRTLRDLGPSAASIPIGHTNLKGNCGPIHAICFHAIAALLNATYYGSRYPSVYNEPSLVISAFATAFMNDRTAGGCTQLNQFKGQVDVYDTGGGLWCFNGISRSSDDWTQQY